MSNNKRYEHYQARVRCRNRLKAIGDPCAICGKPIDYTLDWYIDPKDGKRKRHPYSFEVDEIIPVSKGGSPTDMDNLQAAHRRCNQWRGNKPMEEVRRIIGARDKRNKRSCKALRSHVTDAIEWSGDW